MPLDTSRLRSILESLIFVSEQPVSFRKLRTILEGVPPKELKQALDELVEEYRRTEHGITIEPVTSELASQFRLPVKQGLLVASVKAGTGAAKAGLKAGTRTVIVSGSPYTLGGDIIVAADGTKVGSSMMKLEDIIAGHKPGDSITLEIYRGSKKMTVSVTLGNRG